MIIVYTASIIVGTLFAMWITGLITKWPENVPWDEEDIWR